MVGLSGCGSSPTERPAANGAPGGTGGAAEWFTERRRPRGWTSSTSTACPVSSTIPEIMAPGVALLDYDNDGDLDVYVVQGQMLGSKPLSHATFPPSGALKDRLFRNDLDRERGWDSHVAFHRRDRAERHRHPDRTAWASRPATSTTTGASISTARASTAASCFATTATAPSPTSPGRAGTEDRGGWSVSAAFVDYDRDGWLDLFVGNYLIYSLESDVHCLSVTGQRDYCPPNSYRPQPSRLYHNRGNGTFEDVTSKALVGGALRPGPRRLDRRFQRRRLDRYPRRQRRRAQPALDQPARRHVQGRRRS